MTVIQFSVSEDRALHRAQESYTTVENYYRNRKIDGIIATQLLVRVKAAIEKEDWLQTIILANETIYYLVDEFGELQ